MNNLLNRFLGYVTQETTPDENSLTCPTTVCQLRFAEKLQAELKKIGMKEITLDNNGYVMATLPASGDYSGKTIGFIAHMDTSPEAPATNVSPQIHEQYDGRDLIINTGEGIKLSPDDFSDLRNYIGDTLITTDGTTLLGADDKAGIAEIITAMEYLAGHPEIKHRKIRIAFTPDEEIGRGADLFDVKAFGAHYAYTIDGGGKGEFEFENFNAAMALVKIKGRSVHPGSAKDTMINSINIAMETDMLLPSAERPQHTSGYEGFFHLYDLKGSVEETTMKYIIRDHDTEKFKSKKKLFEEIIESQKLKYPAAEIALTVKDQYYNMKEIIEANTFIIEEAVNAYRKAGIEPVIKPVRGGTDGARLSFLGLPCPNIFTGGHNYHGRFEYIPLQSMEKAVEIIINLTLI